MRLLVTGAGGMLGRDVAAAARAAGHDVSALARADLDVTDRQAVLRAVESARPEALINCAAWTDVDGAEDHEAQATAVNGGGPANLAAAGVPVVHVSTDYVFDGRDPAGSAEDAPAGPLSAYGRSKLAGERALEGHAIVRSSWLFGVGGRNFVDTMLRLGAQRDEVTVVDDQVGSPTFTGHLGRALVEVAERRLTGVLHVAGAGACSWYDLAVTAFEIAGVECRVSRGRTADLGRPAPRPACSVLRSTRADAPTLPDWHEGLHAYLAARDREVIPS